MELELHAGNSVSSRLEHRSLPPVLIRKQPDSQVLVLFLGSLGQQDGDAFTVKDRARRVYRCPPPMFSS